MTAVAGGLVPTHPERGEHPDEVRWVVTGTPADPDAPAVRALVADGTLVAVRCEPGALVTRLAPGRTWTTDGVRVRAAVRAALAHGDGAACRTCPVTGPGCPAATRGPRPAGTFGPPTLLRRR